ncbi:DUF4468 domain-containing protein [Chryseobacterium defluvii]|uniref:Uncharacterized protein with TBP-like fold DUF4468 n=1 Tax=Chryseobacterium defluvii TaxID=160396 RepID=A0A495SLT5_9FLAO|nr:DUF4468 domain-containing protein [Chryseobacterium defluvii]RKT01046.1 uncharacterized protein with TBP-like fold DUF4468 [Chryseobacterium defluvii]
MKKILILTCFFISGIISSQYFEFEEVIKVDSTITKDELFNRARNWIGKSFNDEKYVIATEDRNNGELSGNGKMFYNPSKLFFGSSAVQGDVDFKISIFVKNGRYKYKFYAFRHSGTTVMGNPAISYGMITESNEVPRPSRGQPNKVAWKNIKEQISIKVNKLIDGLKESMNTKYEGNKDW